VNIEVLCVGGLRETYWRGAAAEYAKRLAPYCSLTVTELREERPFGGHGRGGAAGGGAADAYNIALDVRGKRLSSEGFAALLEDLGVSGRSRVRFLIGGADGLSTETLDSADLRLSFSDMTFPHQLMRVILLEQLYRAFKIIKGEPYHK